MTPDEESERQIMSSGSKKWPGFRGALLVAGMMLGTTGTAFATVPANTHDKQKKVEVQKKIETRRTVEIQKRSHTTGAHAGTRANAHVGADTGGSGRAGTWKDINAQRRYEEKQKRLAQQAEASRQRYEARKDWHEERQRQLERRYKEPRHHGWGGSGSGYDRKYEDKQERLEERYQDKKARLKEKYEDKQERLKEKYEDSKKHPRGSGYDRKYEGKKRW